MNEIVKQKAPGLPADFASKLASGIAQSRSSTVLSGGGKPLLRLLRDGLIVHGQANVEVEPDSRWAVNVMSLAHGWSCWVDGGPGAKNKLAGEVMVSIGDPKPPQPEPIQSTPWAEQRSFELKCIDGADNGQEVLYKTTSVGGMRAVDGILAAVQSQLVNNSAYPCPVIVMTAESYPHTKYGKIYNPIFTIVDWSDMNGALLSANPAKPVLSGPAGADAAPWEPTPEPVAEPVAQRVRSRPAAVADAPAPASAPVGQRRRQTAR
jgi:hypothetical protein